MLFANFQRRLITCNFARWSWFGQKSAKDVFSTETPQYPSDLCNSNCCITTYHCKHCSAWDPTCKLPPKQLVKPSLKGRQHASRQQRAIPLPHPSSSETKYIKSYQLFPQFLGSIKKSNHFKTRNSYKLLSFMVKGLICNKKKRIVQKVITSWPSLSANVEQTA